MTALAILAAAATVPLCQNDFSTRASALLIDNVKVCHDKSGPSVILR